MAVEIITVDVSQLYTNDPDLPVVAWAGLDHGRLLGNGGLVWRFGKCWGWLDHVDAAEVNPFTLVRSGRRVLQRAGQLGETVVSAARDPRHANSEKLLKLLGFVLVDPAGVVASNGDTAELWECRLS